MVFRSYFYHLPRHSLHLHWRFGSSHKRQLSVECIINEMRGNAGNSSSLSFLVVLFAYLFTSSVSYKNSFIRNYGLSSRLESTSMIADIIPSATEETSFKVVSFNILAPCYNKLRNEHHADGKSAMEAEFEDKYMARNKAICEQLLRSDADIICLQEYWSGSEELRSLYTNMLCGPKGAGYTFTEQRRTSHWRIRDDGLACFVKDARIVVQDTRAILFHDCGDRVAQMLLLALRPPIGAPENTPAQQFICVNTHLLFPHNEYSTKIRLRELAKILGFVESYRMRELCSTICGRSDVRLPVIIAGDFNGSPLGAVHRFARAQNYYSAFEEYCKQFEPAEVTNSDAYSTDDEDTAGEKSVTRSQDGLNAMIARMNEDKDRGSFAGPDEVDCKGDGMEREILSLEHELLRYDFGSGDDNFVSSSKVRSEDLMKLKKKVKNDYLDLEAEPEHELSASRQLVDSSMFGSTDTAKKQSMRDVWISHRSHREENVPVDHIFYLNPSEQVEKRLPPIPDWTNLVYREIFLRMTENQEIRSIQDIFESFDTATKSFITLEEFKNALVTLGFIGEGKSALTDEEITVLVSCADKDGNGMIDYKEFCDRFWLAANDQEQQQLYSYRFGKKSFFARSNWLSSDLSVVTEAKADEESEEGMDISIISSKSASAAGTKADTASAITVSTKQPVNPPGAPSKLDASGLKLDSLLNTFAAGAKISLDTRHMADLSIQSAHLTPKALEQGIWPEDYTLSDHGMVEVVFKVSAQ